MSQDHETNLIEIFSDKSFKWISFLVSSLSIQTHEAGNILDLSWHLSSCTYQDVKSLMETAA